ncbi:hypothetical protein [Pseudomaricurvus sp. HS19]|uniref:hypothetical protein n=1 Tax=Pseudomaricurvus sp. HS19 TaxID=2692626 RepID=UPI001368FE7E|nr:hypothetical protein [Pseudomaricurvus sp. HS19]MYM63907.1 hypothetical protein [Pseudomaricurvus sp. HS19]
MTRFGLLILGLLPALAFAANWNTEGTVTAVSGDEYGIYLQLDSGRASACSGAPEETLAVKPNYVGAFQVAAASLGQTVKIEADYVPFQRECVVKAIALTNGKATGPKRR